MTNLSHLRADIAAERRFADAARDLAECCAEHEPPYEPDADTALGFLDDAIVRDYVKREPMLIAEAMACVDERGFWMDFADAELLGARVRNAVYGYVAEALASEAQEIEVAA